ncbi:MAG: COG4315 family predicted lipoprotein [Pseudomonadota bacterium]
MIRLAPIAPVAALLLLGACQWPGPGQVAHTIQDTNLGKVLATDKGMTLYTFDRDDERGKSKCNGPCAQNWPPLMAKADAEPVDHWTVVTRDDGSKMWAYKGKPLYVWVRDQKAGDTTGHGFNNVWKAATP